MVQSVGAKEKWDAYALYVNTSTSSKLATFTLTVKHTLGLLGDTNKGRLLDVGCGFGEIDALLAQKTDLEIICCDISDRCIERARENARNANVALRVKVERGDVYKLHYPDNEFDIVTSFGYSSAATYRGAQEEIARVLKPNGFLICDFINALSMYKFIGAIRKLRRMEKGNAKEYNFITTKGIQEYFRGYNFTFVGQRFFNTFPPVNFLPSGCLLLFEQKFGKFFSKFLGRVRLVCFRNSKAV